MLLNTLVKVLVHARYGIFQEENRRSICKIGGSRDREGWDRMGWKEGRVRGGSAHILQGYKEERKLIFGTEGSKRIMYSADQISLQEVA